MGTASEILAELIAAFGTAMPGVDFREAQGEAFRPQGRICAAGTVSKEVTQGDQWSAKLAFTVYVPRGGGSAEEVLDKMALCAKESQPLLTGVERGTTALDRGSGSAAVGCVFSFAKPGSSGGSSGSGSGGSVYPVEINGTACTVKGWKVTSGTSGGGLTAIGEDAPFYYYKGGREFTIELQGLDMAAPEELESFTLRLGEQKATYTGCRWKSLSAGGNCTAAAGDRAEEE